MTGWRKPPRPCGRDLARWAAFRRQIVGRIEAVRRYEPERRAAFGRPLPGLAPAARPLPVGPVVPLPANIDDREPNGRYRRRAV